MAKTIFDFFFKEKIESALLDSGAFNRFAIVTDRDDRDVNLIASEFLHLLCPVISSVEINQWRPNVYKNSFNQNSSLDFLLLVIPTESEGALESLLLKAISENDEDEIIVSQSVDFVEKIQPLASKYLSKNRLKLKAALGVTWAIQYPEKLFQFIDAQIRSVQWENYKVLNSCFEQLKKI